jgi:Fe-S cluster assembly iron-binding protein IscA
LTQENATLFIDPFSEMHLLGTTIDSVTEDIENGSFDSKFVFNIDKKIASSCGCGTSFMPRDIRQ